MDKTIISAEEFKKRYGGQTPSSSPTSPVKLSAQEFQAKYGSPTAPQKTGLEKTGNVLNNIFGGGTIGEAIGTGIAKMRATPDEKQYITPGPSGKEVLGDVGRVALNFAPVGKVATGIKTGATALGIGSKLAKPIAQIGTGAAVGYGADVTTKLAEGQEDPFKPSLGTAVGAGIGALPVVGGAVKTGAKAVLPKSPNIMNRVVRLTPTDANKFERIAGKKHGQYLTETGNLYTPEKVAEKEATKFVNSVKEADNALATLPGNFKTGQIDDAIEMLTERELKVSSPNTPSPDLNRVNFLSAKHKTTGLNMSEVNELKRLFERNVKLGYNKLIESDKVAKATNIDNALREWQFKKADELGLKNLREINKQTQISKFLVDKIGKQITGRSGNEAVNLTDWIILSGGDPTAVSAFLVKKTLSSKNVQAGVARALAPRPFQQPKVAQFGGKSGLPAKIEGVDYSLPKPNNPKYQPIKLPESVRETNLGLDEVKAIRSKPTLQLPAKTESGKAYTDSIKPETKSVKLKLPFKDQRGFIAGSFKNEGNLTTKILKDLEGKTTVSKQYILDATNRGELKQVERDITRQVLDTMPDGQINVKEFADKVKSELLPLKLKKNYNANYPKSVSEGGVPIMSRTKFESISLPSEIRGNVKNYDEHLWESPIKTSAGQTHFPNEGIDNYFGHTRIEDMADNKTRRVIEVQSDLYQKGNLEREVGTGYDFEYLKELEAKKKAGQSYSKSDYENLLAVKKEFEKNPSKNPTKLYQYNDPTAHFRMIREEIKKASQDGKTKLQFPTGETAMKIEGLGENNIWHLGYNQERGGGIRLTQDALKIGEEVVQGSDKWIITDVLGDGKFKAVQKRYYDDVQNQIANEKGGEGYIKRIKDSLEGAKESFDISGKVDTNNPIYKFYEKDVQKYLNKFGGKRVVDDKGVSWIEIPITKEQGINPVEAFGKIKVSPLVAGAGLSLAGAIGAGAINKKRKLPSKPPKLK